MMNMDESTPPREDVEALLPWHAAGTLSRDDAERVEAAIAGDRGLSRRYQLVREELVETIRLNEGLGAPSARALERLMAAIEGEAPVAAGGRASSGFADRLAALLARLSPRALAWSAVAAAALIAMQAGLLAGILAQRGYSRHYETASVSQAPQIGVGFVADATAADITKFLETHHLVVVDGPLAGGLFKLRTEQARAPKDEIDRLVKQMQQESRIVRFAAVAE